MAEFLKVSSVFIWSGGSEVFYVGPCKVESVSGELKKTTINEGQDNMIAKVYPKSNLYRGDTLT